MSLSFVFVGRDQGNGWRNKSVWAKGKKEPEKRNNHKDGLFLSLTERLSHTTGLTTRTRKSKMLHVTSRILFFGSKQMPWWNGLGMIGSFLRRITNPTFMSFFPWTAKDSSNRQRLKKHRKLNGQQKTIWSRWWYKLNIGRPCTSTTHNWIKLQITKHFQASFVETTQCNNLI